MPSTIKIGRLLRFWNAHNKDCGLDASHSSPCHNNASTLALNKRLIHVKKLKALEAQIAAQLKQIDELKNSGELRREIEFEKKHRKLMAEYGANPSGIIALLDPQASASVSASDFSPRQHRPLQVKVYKNQKPER